jgi:CheY-like chemotaxis protein
VVRVGTFPSGAEKGHGSAYDRAMRWMSMSGTNCNPPALTGGSLGGERVSGAIQAGRGRTDRKVVLVVDDEAMVRMLAVELFEELGCEVLEAANGFEALARLEERPDVSLMFTDCRMPGMSGPELAQVAAGRWPTLRIVLVTGYHKMQVPGFPMIWKPYDQRTIERVVADAG